MKRITSAVNATRNVANRVLAPASIHAISHPGLVRMCNEDSYGYCAGLQNAFIAVADGIGGHDYGDVASQRCIRELLSAWRDDLYGLSLSPDEARRFLLQQIAKANASIHSLNAIRHQRNPMGTTLVAACFLKETIVLAHLGDSRCYRVRNGRIRQMTHDHSYVAELIAGHVITPSEAASHPFAHVIYRSVGIQENCETELNIFERRPGDRYLFCSDGALVEFDESEIEAVLYDAQTPKEAAEHILHHALQCGGEDNITAVVAFT